MINRVSLKRIIRSLSHVTGIFARDADDFIKNLIATVGRVTAKDFMVHYIISARVILFYTRLPESRRRYKYDNPRLSA